MFKKLDFVVPIKLIPQVTIPRYKYVRELLVVFRKDFLTAEKITESLVLEGEEGTTKAETETVAKLTSVVFDKITKLTEPTSVVELKVLNSAFNGSYNRISYLVIDSLDNLNDTLQQELQLNYFAVLFLGFTKDEVLAKEIANFTGTKGILISQGEVDDFKPVRNLHAFVDNTGATAIKFYAEYLSNAVLQPRNYVEVSGDVFKSAYSVGIADTYFAKRLNWVSDADIISLDGGFCGDEEFYAPYIKEEVRILIQEAVYTRIANGVPNNNIGNSILEIVSQNAIQRYVETNSWLDAQKSVVTQVVQDANDKFIANTSLSLSVLQTYKRNFITAYEV